MMGKFDHLTIAPDAPPTRRGAGRAREANDMEPALAASWEDGSVEMWRNPQTKAMEPRYVGAPLGFDVEGSAEARDTVRLLRQATGRLDPVYFAATDVDKNGNTTYEVVDEDDENVDVDGVGVFEAECGVRTSVYALNVDGEPDEDDPDLPEKNAEQDARTYHVSFQARQRKQFSKRERKSAEAAV